MSDNTNQTPEGIAGAIEKLRGELDGWLGYALEKGEQAIESVSGRGAPGPVVPSFDVIEVDDAVLVNVDLVGVPGDSVDLTIAGNMLTVAGERTAATYPDSAKVHLRECGIGKFSRSIPLPVPVDADNVSAEAKNGVLAVRLPKLQPKEERRIKVNVG